MKKRFVVGENILSAKDFRNNLVPLSIRVREPAGPGKRYDDSNFDVAPAPRGNRGRRRRFYLCR